ncbi:MAG: DUF1365 domain-containing protein [Methylophilales bacterium]|nr:DUF1365 domain-containing protein [Methylophilales bacterium]
MHCIYQGTITHSRFTSKSHKFSYKTNMLYLDLDDVEGAFTGKVFWSYNRPNFASFYRSDFYGDRNDPIKKSIQALLLKNINLKHRGKIFLLTTIRYFGYSFNPVSFYYCFDESSQIQAIVSHITNTPWNEKHVYVHDCRGKPSMSKKFEFDKEFHVSPFMPMNINYSWVFSAPKDFLFVSMDNYIEDKLIFNATLRMTRRAWTSFMLNKLLFLSFPMSIKSLALIYFNALLLFIKRVKYYPHP